MQDGSQSKQQLSHGKCPEKSKHTDEVVLVMFKVNLPIMSLLRNHCSVVQGN